MPEVSAVRVCSTWGVPLMVGRPVAGVFSSGGVILRATSSPSDQSSPGSFHWN